MKSNYITPPDNCTGCGLCDNVCPKDAIHMVWSKGGFLVPSVDVTACVDCGMCVKQCIALEEKEPYTDDLNSVESYGGWNKDVDIHLSSSSGGVFTALAVKVIEQGGVVFGVVWKDKLTAVFEKTDSEDGLARMRGSKYTPAVPGNVYRDVRNELKNGRQVLFSGTPCQVHALKKYLRKDYENLLTVDIVCHGVPSHLILERYIEEEEEKTGKEIDYVSFRDKPEGWLRYHVTRHYTDGGLQSEALGTDMYMRMFLSDKALNHVCYNCPYAHIPRQGDITLGDYWGVEKLHPEWPIDKGVSSILANTSKGSVALNRLSDRLELRIEPFSKIYNGQKVVYVRPEKVIPPSRSMVLERLRELSVTDVYRKVVQTVTFGPFSLSKFSYIYRLLFTVYRAVKSVKHKLLKK
ncbi:MAG: Coenzyme F420 hydrogenase/dehydrogenase, beta subunit C-terminal domain [Akkermansia sp.]|nr:Coenzyme F420 hydrogenase/dehydrogenase, beta subunit C-terminal domain [Akkermansia sp.]